MPERYEYKGEIYYFNKGSWCYENHIQVPLELKSQLNHRFGKVNRVPVRHKSKRYRQWIIILPGCYGSRG